MELVDLDAELFLITAVTKRNNPMILPRIPPMIKLFFSISISDGVQYSPLSLHPEIIWYNMDIQVLQNHLHHKDLQLFYKTPDHQC